MTDTTSAQAATTDSAKAAASTRKKLTWCVAAFLASPLLLEGGARLRSYVKYGSTQDVFDLYARDPATGLRMPIPGLSTTLAKVAHIEIDSRGFRNPEFVDPKSADTVRLAFLGASPTFCVEVSSNAETWPQLVRDRLAAAHPDASFDYLNAAVSAYGVEDSHKRLMHSVRPFDPDVIVIYHATRDLTQDTFALALNAGLEKWPESSWLEDYSFLWSQIRLNLRYREEQRRGRSSVDKLQFDVAPLALEFGGRVARLVADAQQIADRVVLVTFAIRARRDQPREVLLTNMGHAFTFTPYLSAESILDCYDVYNDATRAVAHDTGALLLEGAMHLPGTAEFFVDSVHLTARGCEKLAELVACGLAKDRRFRALVRR